MPVKLIHTLDPERWKRIHSLLKSDLTSIQSLENFIKTLTFSTRTVYTRLEANFGDEEILTEFLSVAVPRMALMARNLDKFASISLLNGIESSEVQLSRRHCFALLAASFFGVLPSTQQYVDENERSQYQVGSFLSNILSSRVFSEGFLHYFISRAKSDAQFYDALLEFEDQSCAVKLASEKCNTADEMITWKLVECDVSLLNSKMPLQPVTFSEGIAIEDTNCEVQANFANEFIGGGILHCARAQEEILMLFRPELFVSLTFCARMKHRNAIIVENCKRYSVYKGYGSTLTCAGSFDGDEAKVTITCFDALVAYESPQFEAKSIQREVFKCLAAFNFPKLSIATGHWGCGAFGGHKVLKFLEQWIAASACDASLHYCFFSEKLYFDELRELALALVEKEVSARALFDTLIELAQRKELDSKADIIKLVTKALC